jgi:hypothetical protein
LVNAHLLEVACFHDGQHRRIHVLPECRVDLLQRQRLDLRFQLFVVEQVAPKLLVRGDQPDQRRLL